MLEALKTFDYKDLAKRAAWTFIQAFLAVFILSGESIINLVFDGSWEALLTLLLALAVAGIAAGLSALKTLTVQLLETLKTEYK
ncbi:hypothetical protein EOL96_08345 [Candidatus Saccharibacteria bacterium]|nr:hypothetical protein [Candidatus Saccharibacteria bacterium]